MIEQRGASAAIWLAGAPLFASGNGSVDEVCLLQGGQASATVQVEAVRIIIHAAIEVLLLAVDAQAQGLGLGGQALGGGM